MSVALELREACMNGDLEKVKSLFLQRPKPVKSDRQTALYWAVACGHDDVVTFLLEHGAEVDHDTTLGAVSKKSTTLLQALLDHDWNINSCAHGGRSALWFITDDEGLVKWFLEHGADPSLNDDGLSSPLDSAACKGTTTTISLLLKHGAKLDESNALQAAAIGSLGIPMMEYLLDCGFDINAFDVSKKPVLTRGGIGTALHMAAKEGYKDRVQFLLERGALRDIKREDKVCSMTPAEWAKRHGKMEIYEMLSKSTGAASVRRHSLQR